MKLKNKMYNIKRNILNLTNMSHNKLMDYMACAFPSELRLTLAVLSNSRFTKSQQGTLLSQVIRLEHTRCLSIRYFSLTEWNIYIGIAGKGEWKALLEHPRSLSEEWNQVDLEVYRFWEAETHVRFKLTATVDPTRNLLGFSLQNFHLSQESCRGSGK